MNGIGSYWTDEKMSDLRRLANGENSADAIARILGGISRQAVIGKIYRTDGLRLRTISAGCIDRIARKHAANPPRPRATPQRRVKRALPQPQAKPAPSPSLPEKSEDTINIIPIGQRCSLFDLTDSTCRWPIGNPGEKDFFFCGGQSIEGLPYCGYHCRVAYQTVSERRDGHPQAAGVRKSAREGSK